MQDEDNLARYDGLRRKILENGFVLMDEELIYDRIQANDVSNDDKAIFFENSKYSDSNGGDTVKGIYFATNNFWYLLRKDGHVRELHFDSSKALDASQKYIKKNGFEFLEQEINRRISEKDEKALSTPSTTVSSTTDAESKTKDVNYEELIGKIKEMKSKSSRDLGTFSEYTANENVELTLTNNKKLFAEYCISFDVGKPPKTAIIKSRDGNFLLAEIEVESSLHSILKYKLLDQEVAQQRINDINAEYSKYQTFKKSVFEQLKIDPSSPEAKSAQKLYLIKQYTKEDGTTKYDSIIIDFVVHTLDERYIQGTLIHKDDSKIIQYLKGSNIESDNISLNANDHFTKLEALRDAQEQLLKNREENRIEQPEAAVFPTDLSLPNTEVGLSQEDFNKIAIELTQQIKQIKTSNTVNDRVEDNEYKEVILKQGSYAEISLSEEQTFKAQYAMEFTVKGKKYCIAKELNQPDYSLLSSDGEVGKLLPKEEMLSLRKDIMEEFAEKFHDVVSLSDNPPDNVTKDDDALSFKTDRESEHETDDTASEISDEDILQESSAEEEVEEELKITLDQFNDIAHKVRYIRKKSEENGARHNTYHEYSNKTHGVDFYANIQGQNIAYAIIHNTQTNGVQVKIYSEGNWRLATNGEVGQMIDSVAQEYQQCVKAKERFKSSINRVKEKNQQIKKELVKEYKVNLYDIQDCTASKQTIVSKSTFEERKSVLEGIINKQTDDTSKAIVKDRAVDLWLKDLKIYFSNPAKMKSLDVTITALTKAIEEGTPLKDVFKKSSRIGQMPQDREKDVKEKALRTLQGIKHSTHIRS